MVHRYVCLYAVATVIHSLIACGGDGAKFGSGGKLAILGGQDATAKATQSPNLSSFRYSLLVANGDPVVVPGTIPTIPNIFYADNNLPLTEEELARWSVSLSLVGQESLLGGPVVPSSLDVSKSSGMVTVQASFKEIDGSRQGVAFASFFVDSEKPKLSLQRLENVAGVAGAKVFWSATDNYRINPDRTGLIACKTLVSQFQPKNYVEATRLPEGCSLHSAGPELFSSPSTLIIDQVTAGGAKIDAAKAQFALYAEDSVGGFDFTWIKDPAENQSQLILKSSPNSVIYTSAMSVDLTLDLESIHGSLVTPIHDRPADWSSYRMSVVPAASSTPVLEAEFQKKISIPFSVSEDGLYSYNIQVQSTADQLKSNRREVLIVRDTVRPVVSGVQVSVLEGILTPTSKVTVNWTATDANQVSGQTLSIRVTGETMFTPLGTVANGQGSYTFTWGSRPAKGFEIQIAAADPAGNIGIATSPKWAPQVFNAALLTSSVNCFFCHIKVLGDLGGINFPPTTHVHTGLKFDVTDKIFGTNTVPANLARTARNGAVSDYKNSPLVMFPANGEWPVLTAEVLRPRMNGTLRVGSQLVLRNHQGNLILNGSSQAEPIILNGEVFIDGDVVIKGYYRGIGTIYARNIYVVDDVIAVKSPFPFDEDPAKALPQAQKSITEKDDALYLGALKQVLIGNYTTAMGTSCGPEGGSIVCVTDNPFSWLPKDQFVRLGRKAALLKDMDGVARALIGQHYDPTGTDDRAQIEVNRVDAFIYAQRSLVWRSYANILLNGGFMAPYSGIIATSPYRIDVNAANKAINWAPNPRNGLPVTQSIIRYDYRLRAGGGGFETIKSYFEQN